MNTPPGRTHQGPPTPADHRRHRAGDSATLTAYAHEATAVQIHQYSAGTVPDLLRARDYANRAGPRRRLAGIVVAVGGFGTDIMRADLGKLLSLTSGPDYPGPDVRGQLKLPDNKLLDPADKQGDFLRAVRSSRQHAGPDGWLDWTRWSRNDRVHRGARIGMN